MSKGFWIVAIGSGAGAVLMWLLCKFGILEWPSKDNSKDGL